MAFQYDAEQAYVTLHGRALFIDDIQVKRAIWSPESDRFHPKGPDDANVVIIKLLSESIDLYNASRGIQPAPFGLCAVTLTRSGTDWIQGLSSPTGVA
jgi:general stress protein 26